MSNELPRHGGPRDRGSADRYYGRSRRPHYFVGATHQSEEITEDKMSEAAIAEYNEGYDNETDRKDWGSN